MGVISYILFQNIPSSSHEIFFNQKVFPENTMFIWF